MFPMEFDHRVLSSLPLPSREGTERVLKILQTIVSRRVLPYFRARRGTDPAVLARAPDAVRLSRLEDEEGRVRLVALLCREDARWTIAIHERIFDYLAFVIPSHPEQRLGDGTAEEKKMLAFAEFMLRHQMEHVIYPQAAEREVIRSDARFAMDRRSDDPTFYGALRQALVDEMNGIRGRRYMGLLDRAEQERPLESEAGRVLDGLLTALADLPEGSLDPVYGALDQELRGRLVGEYYRRSRSTVHGLIQRAGWVRLLVHLLGRLLSEDPPHARFVFDALKERWGIVALFQELGVSEATLEGKTPEAAFGLFQSAVRAFLARQAGTGPALGVHPVATPPAEGRGAARAEKSLKDRIEEAHGSSAFPPQVLDVIDRNKINAVGHSGTKYSELIETLLAIPWGRIAPIRVTPQAFEEGLNRSHYGLKRPKEILCDFFTNLIWRYQRMDPGGAAARNWRRTGSAFLFVGPPGVGKTSLAISIAQNLGIPFHKISLGGMRDEADLRGHGFTYEGSKPGAIVQGLIKMGIMNGMFILDEADKTEKFAIAALLEILDPEQNHLFHDKYTQTTIDIDLSNCHFVLTANTLETVPPPVANRCEVVFLDRYSVEEKIAIARQHLVVRLREKYLISEEEIFFHPQEEPELFRHLIRNYTYEAGIRELERILRTLLLRIQRKEVLGKGRRGIQVTREKVKEYLEEPRRPRQINDEDRLGEMMGLGVDPDRGVGSLIPIQATPIHVEGGPPERGRGYLSLVQDATGNIQRVMDESRKVATTGIFHCGEALGVDLERAEEPVHLHFLGGSTPKDGPSAGGAIALALTSLLSGRKLRRDVAMTGEIDTQGRITGVGALDVKLETAYDAGCKTLIIPTENLKGDGGVERLPEAFREELQILTYPQWKAPHEPFDHRRHMLQVVAVDHIVQAADVALLDEGDLEAMDSAFVAHARELSEGKNGDPPVGGANLVMIVVKEPEEIDARLVSAAGRSAGVPVVLLVLPLARAKVPGQWSGSGSALTIRPFDPTRETLVSAVRREVGARRGAGRPLTVSLVAPFFFLKRDGIRADALAGEPDLAELRLLANNFTVQGVKIKGCKGVLNRVFCRLAELGPGQLEAVPFLRPQEGIRVVDLGFIPDKYGLDVRRAERILARCLSHWLTWAEGFGGKVHGV